MNSFKGEVYVKNMKFSEKLYAIYQLFPFIKKPSFILSFLFRKKVKIFGYQIDVNDYVTIKNLFLVSRYSKIFEWNNNDCQVDRAD